MTPRAVDRKAESVIRSCYSADEGMAGLRTRFLHALQQAVPYDAAFMAGSDPDTLLFTSAFADAALEAARPLFLDSEFGSHTDVNRFADLARAHNPVASLDSATGGQRADSARWQEIMRPLGMGDELRGALRIDGITWGFLCLHRAGSTGFSSNEMALLRKVAPHAGEAIRRVAAPSATEPPDPSEAVVLVADHLVLALGGAVEEIPGGPVVVGGPLPLPLDGVVRRLEAIETGGAQEFSPPPTIRTTTKTGALVTVHAARLRDASGGGPIVLTIGRTSPAARASLLLAAHGLTAAQRRVAALVLQGRQTGQIVDDLSISAHTVQDHLKAVFDKVGVRSRRELVSALMQPSR